MNTSNSKNSTTLAKPTDNLLKTIGASLRKDKSREDLSMKPNGSNDDRNILKRDIFK